MKLLLILLIASFSLKAQTIHEDTNPALSCVNIADTVWGGHVCNMLYISSYQSNMSTSATIRVELAYKDSNGAHFVAPPIEYMFSGAEYNDSVKQSRKPYIVNIIMQANGLRER